MVRYVELLYSFSRVLKDNFPKFNILIDENKKAITTPTFYLQVVPLESSTVLSDKRLKLTDVYITYLDKIVTNEKGLLIMDDLIETFEGINILRDKYDKEPRYLPIMKRKIIKIDNAPTLKLTFHYYDDRRQPIIDNPSETYEDLMEIINMNIYVKDIDEIKEVVTKS